MTARQLSPISFFYSWLSALLCTLVLGSVSACSTDDIVDEVHYEGNAEGRYVRLNISVSVGEGSRATRATTNPNGGENGNGSEVGTADENAVEKVTIFLFKQSSTTGTNGINDANAANIYVHAYCWDVTPTTSNADGEPVYTTGAQPLTTALEYGTYQVLAVANADLTVLNGATLQTVREQLYDHSPYTTTGTLTTDFVMASAADATITISETAITQSNGVVEDGSQAKPFSAEIDVERLAARIDFDTDGGTKISSTDLLTELNGEKKETDASYVTLPDYVTTAYKYDVTTTETGVTDALYLTSVTPFNTTQQARLFKYVGEPDAANKATITSYAYLAEEDPNNDQTTGNVQQNYVVDPYFSYKTAASTTDFSAFYTAFYTAALRRSLLDSDDDVLEETIAKYPVKDVSSSSNTYYTVSYTTENTFSTTVQGDDDLMSAYATGLRFDGYYKFSSSRTDDRAGLVFPVHYYYYLRHSDPTGKAEATAVMRNGVVRNNIYRVSISHVNEVTNFSLLKIIIKVVPWQEYTHEEIVM